MEWDTYELISNIGDDIMTMASREDKTLIFTAGGDNAQRHAAFDALREAGVVQINHEGAAVIVSLTI